MMTQERREACRRGGKARAALPDFQEHQRAAGKRSAVVNDMAALGHRGAVWDRLGKVIPIPNVSTRIKTKARRFMSTPPGRQSCRF